jgi:hypothetical protein
MLPPKMMIASGALLAAWLIAASAAQAQTVWYVNDDGDAGNGCTSWLDACPELQTALSLAGDGDQIWVAEGTYLPDYDVKTGLHTGDREASFHLISGVALYGGFDGKEKTLENRAKLFDDTILCGDLACNDDDPGGDGGGSVHHVVFADNTPASTILDGFTITGGRGYYKYSEYNTGGGMVIDQGSPTVRNCTFSDNGAIRGGGMFVTGGAPRIAHCRFVDNTAFEGAGMATSSSSAIVIDCLFLNNLALGVVCVPGLCFEFRGGGAGMSNWGGSPTVLDCAFIGNTVLPDFSGEAWGGGMRNTVSSAVVTNCIFTGNIADDSWGTSYGGAVLNEGSDPTLTNCTLWSNTAGIGGGMCNLESTPTARNCIFWGNYGGQVTDDPDSQTTISFSIIPHGWPGPGNIQANPLFIDPDGPDDDPSTWQDNDLHLSAGSPCIDAADNGAVPADATDLDGLPRFIDDPLTPDTGAGDCPMVDMGAYEFQDGTTTCCPADFDGDGTVGPADLAELLGSWGPCEGCPVDLDGNGQVGPFDLALLLGNWGLCP